MRIQCPTLAALALFGLGCIPPAIAQYAPPDQRTVYDSWMRDIRSNRPSTRSPVPQTDQAAKFRAAQAQNRYNDQQQKMFAEQNARIARENERIRALNADYDRLAALGQKALAGSVDAMREYGFELMNRADSSERTKETGRAWVQAASDHGDAVSKQWLRQQAAQLAQKREEAEKNARDAALAESIRTEIVKAKAGNVDSMCWLGMRYYFDGTPAQRQFSREWLEQAVAHNDKGTLLFLVDQTRNGIGTPGELAQAIDYRRRLAELPNQSTVCLELGGIYLTGKFGVTADRAIAAPYLEKAAAGGQLDAWFMLAEACDHAIAGPRDREAAISCYRAALAQPLKKYYSDKKTTRRWRCRSCCSIPQAIHPCTPPSCSSCGIKTSRSTHRPAKPSASSQPMRSRAASSVSRIATVDCSTFHARCATDRTGPIRRNSRIGR